MTGFDDEQIETMIAAQEAGEYPPDTAQDWQPEPDYDDGPDEYSVYMAEREDRLAQRLDLPFRDIPTARCINREGLDVYTAWGHAFGRGLVTTTEFVKFLRG